VIIAFNEMYYMNEMTQLCMRYDFEVTNL